MKKTPRLHNIFNGAMILSAAAIIAKVLSAVYRVPLQNLVGNEGFYVYQQVYPIYGIGITLALSGLPVFISKLIAETDSEHVIGVARQIFKYLAVFAVLVTLLVWLTAPMIGGLMGDAQLEEPIRCVSLMFLWLPFLAVSRGLEQGRYSMMPTAVSQLVEQVFRVTIVIAVAILFLPMKWTIYQMGTYAMASAFIAGMASTIVLNKSWRPILRSKQVSPVPAKKMIIQLIEQGGIICLFASMMILLQLVDSFTVLHGLRDAGMSLDAAQNLKGIYDRNQPLIQLGLVVASSFSAALLPALAQTYVSGRMPQFKRILSSLMHVCLTIASLATVGLIAILPQVNQLLFADRSQTLALQISVASILIASMVNVFSSVLQSLNYFKITIGALLAGILVKVLLNKWLVVNIGVVGASIATTASLLVILLILLVALTQALEYYRFDIRFGVKLIVINAVMAIVAVTLSTIFDHLLGRSRLMMIPNVVLTIAVAIAVTLELSVSIHLLKISELVTIPGGKQLLRLIKKIHKG